MRCFVISNCTHAPLSQYLDATGLFSKVDSIALFNIPHAELDAYYDSLKDYDLVVSAVHDDPKWGPFFYTNMKSDMPDKVLFFVAPFFAGLHPDLTHISRDGARFPSPVSDYHSAMIYWGHVNGVPKARLREMYHDGEMPEFINLKKIWDDSVTEVNNRERAADIKIAPKIVEHCLNKPAMLTFNHPSMDIIAEIGLQVCQHIGKGKNLGPMDTSTIYNVLTSDVVFPVYPAVYKAFDLKYKGPETFKFGLSAPQNRKGYISFEGFLDLSYARYSAANQGALKMTTPLRLAQAFQNTQQKDTGATA